MTRLSSRITRLAGISGLALITLSAPGCKSAAQFLYQTADDIIDYDKGDDCKCGYCDPCNCVKPGQCGYRQGDEPNDKED